MHSSGLMKYCSASSVEWMQSTGQTSTQLLSLTPMHGCAITYVMATALLAHPSEVGRQMGWVRSDPLWHARALVGDELAGGDEYKRSEERRVGKECRSRWSPYH